MPHRASEEINLPVALDISKLRRGTIIWTEIADHNGFRKKRPAIIWTPTEEIRNDEPLVLIAITSTFSDPPSDDHVPIPWKNGGHPRTGLNRRNAAVVTWFAEVPVAEIIEISGEVPAKQMKQIA